MGSDKGWVASLVHASLNCYKLVIIVGIFWEQSNHIRIKQSDKNWRIQQCFWFQMFFASGRIHFKICAYVLCRHVPDFLAFVWSPLGITTLILYTSILMHTPRLPKVHFHSAPKCNIYSEQYIYNIQVIIWSTSFVCCLYGFSSHASHS